MIYLTFIKNALKLFLVILIFNFYLSEVHAATSFEVIYNSSSFNPASLTISKGDTVVWKNTSSGTFVEIASDPHPVHTDYLPLNLGLISPGSSKSLVFNDLGTFGYHNHLVAGQTGQIIVISPVTITPTPTQCNLQGDANGDCKVDGIDYATWWLNFGKTTSLGKSAGDFNNDTKVDGIDYAVWFLNFGKSA